MAPNSIFGRDDDQPVPDPASEGVRLLGADEVAEAAEKAEAARRLGPDEKKYGDRPEPPPADVKPAMRFPLADSSDPTEFDRPRTAPVTPRTAEDPTGTAPVVSVSPPTGETQLPHWTEPATGEVPRVVIGDQEGEEDDEGKWAAFAASSPRWRDQNTDWERESDTGFEFVHDEDSRLGALDETERPMDEDYLTFEDLEVPDAATPTAARRRSPDDPIRIQTEGRRPTVTIGEPLGSGGGGRGRADRPVDPGGDDLEPPPPARDRQQAIQVGVGVAVGALVIFLLGAFVAQWIPLLLIIAAVVGSLAEFFNATSRAGFRPLREIGLIAAAALPLAAYATGSPAVPQGESGMMLVLFLTLVASMAWYLFGAGKGRPVANMAITLFGVFYIAALGGYGALILRSGPWANVVSTGEPVVQGVAYFIVIALGTTMYDAVGYLAGSRIGKTPLSAASPNKTREGLLAGMGASLLTVVIFGGFFGIGLDGLGQALILGVVIALVAPIGDLFESMIKRDLGVKDMGSELPSHGGLLDRLDAYLFTLPAAYYTLRMLGLIA
jgi:phosphatidate cytidylyltransferase